jgi:hypothetical protein
VPLFIRCDVSCGGGESESESERSENRFASFDSKQANGNEHEHP